MTGALHFTVPGDARGKGRPRATKRGAFVRMYTDDKTAAYENLVALAATEAMQGREPFAVPVSLALFIRVTPPASVSGKKRAAMLAGELHPAKKPDLTNVVKACEDGCNAIAYTDDAMIVRLQAEKVYALTAGVDVRIEPIGAAA